MSHFVVGNNLAFLVAHHAVFLFFTADCHEFKGFKQIRLVDKFASMLYCIDCSLIDDIGEIGSYESRACKCKCIEIHTLIHMHIFCVYF